MLSFTLKRTKRTPLPTIMILLFGLVLSAVLCGLHSFNEAEQRSYEETRRTVPVTVSITNLSGTKRDDLEIPGWVADLLTKGDGLSGYMKDVQLKTTHPISNFDELKSACLVGLTSASADKRLWPENGASITWREGYGETIFSGDAPLCLAPESVTKDWDTETPGQQLYLYFFTPKPGLGETEMLEFELYLTVAGTYSGGTGNVIYASYDIVERVWYRMQQDRVIDSVSATLADNDLLDELKARIGDWFAVPNPAGAKTEWGHFGYEYYLYALDVNDSTLQSLSATLKNSILINRICTLLIFVLSAGVGFLVGFLMIRHRKREIGLMRTLGTSNCTVYLTFVLEQVCSIVLGTILGGVFFGWQPASRLLAFVGIYFASLTASLIVFLHRNLLATMKEDE